MAENNQSGREGCIGLIVIILIIGFIADKFGCNNNNEEDKPSKEKIETVVSNILSKEDSNQIQNELLKIISVVDANNKRSIAVLDQLNNQLNAYTNYHTSRYNVYEAAKIAKSTVRKIHDNTYSIETPQKLSENLKDSLLHGLVLIQSCYLDLESGYKAAMRFINGEENYDAIDDYRENLNSATSEFAEGYVIIKKVQASFGLKKSKKKKGY